MISEDQFAPIAVTVRSGQDECLHLGAIVALEADGSVAWSVGDPTVSIYPRSSTKPVQALSMVAAGLDLPPDLLALVCASHDGRTEHIAGATKILAGAGLDASALANTADLPLDPVTAEAVLRGGGQRSAIQMNCSGKHAGMLATCVLNGWAHDASYLDPEHPLQRRITETVSALTGLENPLIGIDGCGAPAHVMPLDALARCFSAIASGAAGSAGRAVYDAMTTHPEMVGGPARDVTRMMQAVPGLVMKDGAQGVLAAAMPDGRAIALKVADGADRARPVAMMAALDAIGVDLTMVDPSIWRLPVLGHGRAVGEVRAVGAVWDRLGTLAAP